MNGFDNCRKITIGVAVLGGLALWILLALGSRGWFSSLLIAALLAAAGALLVLALVCPGMAAGDEAATGKSGDPAGPATLDRQDPATGPAASAPSDAATVETGGRQTESTRAPGTKEAGVNDTAVLDDAAPASAAPVSEEDEDLGEEVARAQALDREAAGEDDAAQPEMPDGVAAEMRREPALLEAPRGQPDDLKQLRGVGPKLEENLNRLGVWHLRQIASWSEGEAAWIDDHLEGFKGRIQRDDWIGQARELTKDEA